MTAAKRVVLAASLAGFGIWGGLALAHDPRGTAAAHTTVASPAATDDSSTAPDDNGFFDDPGAGAQLSTPSAGAQAQARSGAS